MSYDDDNFWKKLVRRQYHLLEFVLIPLIIYGIIEWLTKSFVLAITLAVISLVIWIIIFFKKGVYKEIL
jgi:hypothetical protein